MANLTWVSAGERSVNGVCAGATDTFDTTSATAGMNLDGVSAFIVTAEADSGQTLTGAVQLSAYYYDPNTLRWGRFPAFDLDSGSAAAARTQTVAVQDVSVPTGRVGYCPKASGTTAVSSGGFTFRLVAVDRNGRKL